MDLSDVICDDGDVLLYDLNVTRSLLGLYCVVFSVHIGICLNEAFIVYCTWHFMTEFVVISDGFKFVTNGDICWCK